MRLRPLRHVSRLLCVVEPLELLHEPQTMLLPVSTLATPTTPPDTHLPLFPAFVMRRIKAEAVLDSFFASVTMRAASGVPCAGSLGRDDMLPRCCCCTLLLVVPPFTARSSPIRPDTSSSPPPPASPSLCLPSPLLLSKAPVFAASTTSAVVGEAAVRNALHATPPPPPRPAPTPKLAALEQRWACLSDERSVLASATEVDPRGRDRT